MRQQITEHRTQLLKIQSNSYTALAFGILTARKLRRLLNYRLKKGVSMKSIVMPVSEQLKEETIKQLAELKETVAKEAIVKNKKKKRFTAQEMWNHRRRRMRSASDMMRRRNLN